LPASGRLMVKYAAGASTLKVVVGSLTMRDIITRMDEMQAGRS
jgi:hypothetical protein